MFEKIAAGIEDAIAFVEGDATRGRRANADVTAPRAALPKTIAADPDSVRHLILRVGR